MVCVLNVEGDLSTLPTEAQLFNDPYPFGLDPVRMMITFVVLLLSVSPLSSLLSTLTSLLNLSFPL